jgi:hypothetical protein
MQSISKAIAALLAGAIVPFFAYFGVTGDMPFGDAVEMILFALFSGVFTFLSVYIAPKNK